MRPLLQAPRPACSVLHVQRCSHTNGSICPAYKREHLSSLRRAFWTPPRPLWLVSLSPAKDLYEDMELDNAREVETQTPVYPKSQEPRQKIPHAIHLYKYICINTHTHIYIYIYIYMCVCILHTPHTDTHRHRHTHTHKHTHTHTHTCAPSRRPSEAQVARGGTPGLGLMVDLRT